MTASTALTVAIWIGVMLIGGIGSVLRFLVDRSVARRLARTFPYGTLTVNITGAALLGFLPAWRCRKTQPYWPARGSSAPTPPFPPGC